MLKITQAHSWQKWKRQLSLCRMFLRSTMGLPCCNRLDCCFSCFLVMTMCTFAHITGAWLLWMSLEELRLPLMGWQLHGAAVNIYYLPKPTRCLPRTWRACQNLQPSIQTWRSSILKSTWETTASISSSGWRMVSGKYHTMVFCWQRWLVSLLQWSTLQQASLHGSQNRKWWGRTTTASSTGRSRWRTRSRNGSSAWSNPTKAMTTSGKRCRISRTAMLQAAWHEKKNICKKEFLFLSPTAGSMYGLWSYGCSHVGHPLPPTSLVQTMNGVG